MGREGAAGRQGSLLVENLGDNGFKEDRCSAAVFITVAVQ